MLVLSLREPDRPPAQGTVCRRLVASQTTTHRKNQFLFTFAKFSFP